MKKLALTIEYDGTGFVGWQMQPRGRTVQDDIERALKRILQQDIRITAAGRTDTGVHATGQIAHFTTSSPMPPKRIQRALNGVLGSDIVIRHVQQVGESFHARFDAIARAYRYRILERPTALRRRFTWYVPYTLDVESIQKAGDALTGDHDFTSFCQAAAAREGARCNITKLHWHMEGDELLLDIQANRFLHHMVRTIVGTSVEIGRGRWNKVKMREILDARDRRSAGPNAPAQGLCLVRVSYPGTAGLLSETPPD